MHPIDITILIISVLAVVLVGYLANRRRSDTADYFVAGRSLGWFLAGTSMVATTFSADTPLFVAGITRSKGIAENWFWWCFAIGQLASVFFFARLWRRTEVVTEIEFLTIRYEPGPARDFLRVFRACYEGLLINCLIMAAVLLSVDKITQVLLPTLGTAMVTVPLLGAVKLGTLILVALALVPLTMVLTVGLEGMVWAEALQFGLAMAGTITLALLVYNQYMEPENSLTIQLTSMPGFSPDLLSIVPNLGNLGEGDLKAWSFLILVTVGWWQFVPSGSYFVQRLLASKSERDSLLSLLWFNVAHYVLRPWPWIVVGLISMAYFPNLTDPEQAYPLMVRKFMPVGLLGVLVAALFAAFLSTTFTHLNWGTSYLVNDVYRPYIKPKASDRHYVKVTKWVMVGLTAITLVVCLQLQSIVETFRFVYAVLGGMSLVMILRWYWWRVNVYAEIAALVTALLTAAVLENWGRYAGGDYYAIRLLINTVITTAVWVTVALLTSQAPGQVAINFYQKMRIPGPGWRRIRQKTGVQAVPGELWTNTKATLASLVFLYSCLLGIGSLVLGETREGIIAMVLAVAAAWWLGRIMRTFSWK